jgi:hypothetical protein
MQPSPFLADIMKHVDDQLAANPWLVGDESPQEEEPRIPAHLLQLREAIETPVEKRVTPAALKVCEKLLQALERMHASAKYGPIKVETNSPLRSCQ